MDEYTLGRLLVGKEATHEQQASTINPRTASIIEMVAVTSSVSGEVVVRCIEDDPDEIWLEGEPGVDFIEVDDDGDFEEEPSDNEDDTELPEEVVLDTTDGDGANIEEVVAKTAAFAIQERYSATLLTEEEEEVSQENDPVPGPDAVVEGDGEEDEPEEPETPNENDPAPGPDAVVEGDGEEEGTLSDDEDPDVSDDPLEDVEVSDGSAIVETTVSVKAGDRVMVSVQDGHMTVVGVIGGGDEEYAERMLLEQAQQEVAQEAEEAKAAAEAAAGIAEAAQTAADTANANAEAAQKAVGTVLEEAENAANAANEAKSAVSAIANDLNSVKSDASQTLAEAIDGLTDRKVETMAAGYATNDDLKQQEVALKGEIERSAGKIQTTMQVEYARKTDLTEATVELQSQVTQTAGKISASVSNIAEAMANLQSDDVKAAIQAAKAQLEAASTDLADAKSALATAQIEANNATVNASLAQNLASDANAALANAQRELADAQAYRDRLVELGGTTEEIEEAEAAVTEAQKAVTEAQSAANEATANAEAAVQAAETAAAAVAAAEGDVEAAQEAYDLAVEGLNQATYSSFEQTAEAITSRVTKTEVDEALDGVTERVMVSESAIEQLANSLSSIVRSGEETSLVRQDENGLFYFDIEALQNSADASANSLADIMKALGDIDPEGEETLLGKLSKMESALEAVGLKTEYVTVSEYEGEPCIILGETDSTFKLLITNTRIVFLEGSTETTYIRNNTLVTNNVEVKEEIRQGRWAWKARPNGNLGLVWIGGDE